MTTPPGAPPDLDKAALRAGIRARRRARTDAARDSVAQAVAREAALLPEVLALVEDPSAGCLAAYASFGGEPGTGPLRELLAAAGVRVLLPVVDDAVLAGEPLGWAWDDGDDGVGADPRIPQPAGPVLGRGAEVLVSERCRLVLVPAHAVGRDGERLGQGGGHYDRVLAALPRGSQPRLVAVVHADEVLDALPVEPHDCRVDAALTPQGVVELS